MVETLTDRIAEIVRPWLRRKRDAFTNWHAAVIVLLLLILTATTGRNT